MIPATFVLVSEKLAALLVEGSVAEWTGLINLPHAAKFLVFEAICATRHQQGRLLFDFLKAVNTCIG